MFTTQAVLVVKQGVWVMFRPFSVTIRAISAMIRGGLAGTQAARDTIQVIRIQIRNSWIWILTERICIRTKGIYILTKRI